MPPIRTLDEATAFLYERLGRTPGRSGAGLERARALLAALGEPQERFRAVHVAGTAGKGSVVTLVASLLHAHGFAVGAHLSPHAHSILERFQLDGRPVDEPTLVCTLAGVVPAIRAVAGTGPDLPTFFEVTTALAYRIFADRAVDYAVVETGLGGRLDATNTIRRADKLALLTVIGRDHTEILGESLPGIATEKAGILPRHGEGLALRPRSAAVTAAVVAEAARRDCRLELVDPGSAPVPATALGMPGRHQADNAALALRAVARLAERDGWRVDPDAVRHGLRAARLPGRFERRRFHGHPVVLDGAHNPLKLGSVVSVLRAEHPGERFVWLLAMKPDKDLPAALDVVAPAASAVVATEFADHAAGCSVPAETLADAARQAGVPVVAVAPRPADGLRRAVALSAPRSPVVVAGSFHLVAAAGPALGEAVAAGPSVVSLRP